MAIESNFEHQTFNWIKYTSNVLVINYYLSKFNLGGIFEYIIVILDLYSW